ncbi:TPA: hypothetical protein ACNCI6_004753, partial [Escherichia coli]
TPSYTKSVSWQHHQSPVLKIAQGEKVFFDLIVHTVHLSFFSFNFSVITGEYTVKGEQWIVHLRGIQG